MDERGAGGSSFLQCSLLGVVAVGRLTKQHFPNSPDHSNYWGPCEIWIPRVNLCEYQTSRTGYLTKDSPLGDSYAQINVGHTKNGKDRLFSSQIEYVYFKE